MVQAFFDVSVVLIEDECGGQCELREIERHPDGNEVGGCCVFSGWPEQ